VHVVPCLEHNQGHLTELHGVCVGQYLIELGKCTPFVSNKGIELVRWEPVSSWRVIQFCFEFLISVASHRPSCASSEQCNDKPSEQSNLKTVDSALHLWEHRRRRRTPREKVATEKTAQETGASCVDSARLVGNR